MQKNRFIMVKADEYQKAVNILDKENVKSKNGDIQFYWHWLTAIGAWAIAGLVLTAIHLLNAPK